MEAGDDYEEVSTIFVAGFPGDASQRELDNLCRFMPGFVNSKVSFGKGTTLFALFDSPMSAQAAIDVLRDQAYDRLNPAETLRVVMARSNMRNEQPTRGPPPPQYPPPRQQPAYGAAPGYNGGGGNDRGGYSRGGYDRGYATQGARQQPPPPIGYSGGHSPGWGGSQGPPQKRARTEDPGSIDTVAVVGAMERGIDEAALNQFFSQQPGFLVFKVNQKMGGGFAKFMAPDMAREAVGQAESQGIPASIARSSMSAPS
eukprot:TRINITY_DN91304_c0_g1_i1.p1 TRINITY_DN91304_c0_g1~~TRINITY_DN91304_c0_g1_i1.p1  ORF type:complete len:278 (-),score=45.67 TRINITY_DN91304_c0_g1_i1:49-819(-)